MPCLNEEILREICLETRNHNPEETGKMLSNLMLCGKQGFEAVLKTFNFRKGICFYKDKVWVYHEKVGYFFHPNPSKHVPINLVDFIQREVVFKCKFPVVANFAFI